MQRPLLWVGVAYMAGSVWAALEHSLQSGLLMSVLIMIIAGRFRRQILKSWSFYILPVFFMSSFANFCRAEVYPCEDLLSGDSAYVSFFGTVTSCEIKDNSVSVIIKSAIVGQEDMGTEEKTGRPGLLIYLDKMEEVPGTGDVIFGTGQMKKPDQATNPGQFNAARYYHARGIDYILWADKTDIISHTDSYQGWLQWFREKWIDIYYRSLTEKDAGTMSAVLMGDKTMLDEELQELYQEAGIVHILAISGLHISMIGMSIFGLLRNLGAGFRVSSCVAGFLVLSYGVMTGFSTSTERAVIMFIVRMGAAYMGRSYDMLSALGLSVLIILTRQPLMITQAGIQFSYAAVLSISILWPAMQRILTGKREGRGDDQKGGMKEKDILKKKIIAHIGPSAAAFIGTLPLTAFYYGEIPLTGFFINLFVLPAMEILVPVGLILGIAGFVLQPVSIFLGGSVHFILTLNEWLCRLSVRLPFSVWRTGTPPLVMVIFYYMVLLSFVILASLDNSRKYGKKLLLLLAACGLILVPVSRMNPMVAFLDVGQGDCIFIRSPSGTTWLVDGGSSDVSNVGKNRIEPFLNYYGEAGVDYACVTHGDEDHLSGIRELLEEKRVRYLVLTGISVEDPVCVELANVASAKGIETIYINGGDCWQSGEWFFECLYPEAEESCEDKNDSSMILKLQAGEKCFLLTGDISKKGEAELDGEKLQGTDILKVAHHGSGSSSSEEFLKNTGAKLAIISCGKNNRYGHPAKETVERLENAGMDIRMTTEDGAVLMLYRNGKFEISSWLEK